MTGIETKACRTRKPRRKRRKKTSSNAFAKSICLVLSCIIYRKLYFVKGAVVYCQGLGPGEAAGPRSGNALLIREVQLHYPSAIAPAAPQGCAGPPLLDRWSWHS
jgi:hypothetical protein